MYYASADIKKDRGGEEQPCLGLVDPNFSFQPYLFMFQSWDFLLRMRWGDGLLNQLVHACLLSVSLTADFFSASHEHT